LILVNVADPPAAMDVDYIEPLVLGLGSIEPAPAVVVQVTGKL
jgi:hypothetical protein